MGREVRRVPPNWVHPTEFVYGQERKIPMLDQTYESALKEWTENKRRWDAGENPSREKNRNPDGSYLTYEEWEVPAPNPRYYRPWKDEEATWYQCWEHVSEGTPVSPPFETREELITYLAQYGDEWDQKRGDPPWGYAAAKRFVEAEWAPSAILIGGKMVDGKLHS